MGSPDPFGELKTRVNALAAKFLDAQISEEDKALQESKELPTPDLEYIASFRLLVHGELEDYFEKRARLKLESLQNKFKADPITTSDFAILILVYLNEMDFNLGSKVTNDKKLNLNVITQQALGYANDIIKKNNGIKEESIITLSAIMGYLRDELDQALIVDLNTYGKKRGDIAHQGIRKANVNLDSPLTEKNNVLGILDLIENYYEKSDFNNTPVEIRLINNVKFQFVRLYRMLKYWFKAL